MSSLQHTFQASPILLVCRMVATLFDLQSHICNGENVSDFDALQMGPLIQMPLVRSLFQVPVGQTEIIKVCNQLSTERH